MAQHHTYIDERAAAYARVTHELHAALAALQRARTITVTFGLSLELPAEHLFIAAIHDCAHAHDQEKT